MTRDEPSVESADTPEEKILHRVPLETLLCSIIAAALGFVLFDTLIALLVLAGGLFSMLNFYWLKQTISKIISPDKKKSIRSAIPLYIVRILLILAIFFIIILSFSQRIYAFMTGFSTMILVFLIEAIAALSSMKTWKN